MLDAETVDSLNQLFGLPNVTENKFIHLDCQSEYGLNGSLNRVGDLCARAAADGQSSLALTDVGNLYGAIHFFKAAQEYGIKPIMGCRIHVAPESRLHKPYSFKAKPGSQLILLAKDVVGFQNLITLVSFAHLEGYFYRPRVDKELLSRYQEGLIAISPSRNGPVSACLFNKNIGAASEVAGVFAGIFADRFYLAIEPNDISGSTEINVTTAELATSARLPLVATIPCRYLNRNESLFYDVLWCIQSGTQLKDIHRYKSGSHPLYYRSSDEASLLFSDHPEALKSTVQIAEACNVDLAAFIRTLSDNSGCNYARQHFTVPGQAIGTISFHRWSIPELIVDVGQVFGYEPEHAQQVYLKVKAKESTLDYDQIFLTADSSSTSDQFSNPELLYFSVKRIAGHVSHLAQKTEHYLPIQQIIGKIPICLDEKCTQVSQWDRESLSYLEVE